MNDIKWNVTSDKAKDLVYAIGMQATEDYKRAYRSLMAGRNHVSHNLRRHPSLEMHEIETFFDLLFGSKDLRNKFCEKLKAEAMSNKGTRKKVSKSARA